MECGRLNQQIPISIPAQVEKKADAAGMQKANPLQADCYEIKRIEGEWVRGGDQSTYSKVYGAVGAAIGSFSSHLLVPASAGCLGALAASAAGLGTLGIAVAGAVATVAGFKVQFKTWVGRQIGGRLGALVGALAAPAAHLVGIPLHSTHIETAKNYSYSGMTDLLGKVSHNSHPRIPDQEARAFIAKLQPGDFVLTNDEASTPFALATVILTGRSDFTHGIVYIGNGKTVEAKMENGIREGDLLDVLQQKHHAIALRPHYLPGQADQVVKIARELIGKPYDFKFRMNNDSFYCSEVVYEVLKRGAPQVKFKARPLITREVIVPSDLLKTPDADVVAEAGVKRTFFDSYLAKFVP